MWWGQLKSKIVDRYPGLVQEFPGSKWPKTSIACLYDNRRLSMEDLEKLRRICRYEMSTLCPKMDAGCIGGNANWCKCLHGNWCLSFEMHLALWTLANWCFEDFRRKWSITILYFYSEEESMILCLVVVEKLFLPNILQKLKYWNQVWMMCLQRGRLCGAWRTGKCGWLISCFICKLLPWSDLHVNRYHP